MSPKINEVLYGFTLSTIETEDSGQCDDDDISQKNTLGLLNKEEEDDWDDSYSTTDDSDCSNSLYHECSGECSRTEISLQQKVEELTELLAARDQTILKLAARLKEKGDSLEELRPRHEIECNVTCKISSPALKSSRGTTARMSFDSRRSNQGSFNEFIVKLSEELDCKLSEIDQMKLDHEMQIDHINDSLLLTYETFESELLAKEEQIAAMATNSLLSTTNSSLRTNQTENIHSPRVEMLVTELTMLKEELDSLRQALHLGSNAFHEALTQYCNIIMKSIREEFDSLHANKLRSYNEPLRDEREGTRWENEKSKSEAQRTKNEKYDVAADETKRSDSNADSETPRTTVDQIPITLLSPLPTYESWSDFCKRFREALAGNENKGCPEMLVLDDNGKVRADMFFKELCFVREGPPLREINTYHDTSERDDIFIDAISEPEY